ncbi:tetratricopeptide repeat protein [Colwelliaceae bacterium 6441]
MSVINQMLKDLDKRQGEQQGTATNQVLINRTRSPIKLVVIITLIVIAINVFGIFVWQLYNENETLKLESTSSQLQRSQQANPSVKEVDTRLKSEAEQQHINTLTQAVNAEKNALTLTGEQLANTQQSRDITDDSDVNTDAKGAAKVKNSPLQEARIVEAEKMVNENENTLAVKEVKRPINNGSVTVDKPTLSISRKQLSASELAAQKVSQAEQALVDNDFSKAEKLFEDVLLVSPEHKTARKQLAALWFGRQLYQAAINLLSQGIQLSPQDSEFRLMKARIYLKQGQVAEAVNTLKALPTVKSTEYQALLASNAQQVSEFDVAISAYQRLTSLEPNVARWWLGLAVGYDSNSNFELAKSAYRQALDSNELSENAQQFARQRLQALGE